MATPPTMPGCQLHIGMEYVATNNQGMAQQYFMQAYGILSTVLTCSRIAQVLLHTGIRSIIYCIDLFPVNMRPYGHHTYTGICNHDAAVMHEIGVIAYKIGSFVQAKRSILLFLLSHSFSLSLSCSLSCARFLSLYIFIYVICYVYINS